MILISINKKKSSPKKLLNINWNQTLLNITDVDTAFNTFWQKVNPIINEFLPLKKVSNKEYKRKYKPWITKGLQISIKRRDRLLKQYIKAKNIIVKSATYTEYKKLRNEIVKLIQTSKNNFYANYFHVNNKNLRKIWSGIKSIINIRDQTSSPPTCIQQNDKLLTEPVDIANSFIKTYSSVADDILDKRKYEGDGNFRKFLPPSSINSIRIEKTNETEICNIINSLSPKNPLVQIVYPRMFYFTCRRNLHYPLQN